MKFSSAILVCLAALNGTAALAADPEGVATRDDITALKAQIEELRALVPSQSHAMTDVDFQFTNLWFAGRAKNWPLAGFYLNETRSHLAWTVRLRPVRKLSGGQDLPLAPFVQAIETSGFTPLRSAIDAHDMKNFEAGYRATLNACHACHVAAEKPFLKPEVPTAPATHLIRMPPG